MAGVLVTAPLPARYGEQHHDLIVDAAIVSMKNSLRANIDRLHGYNRHLAEGILQTVDAKGGDITARQGEQIVRLARIAARGRKGKSTWAPHPLPGETPLQTWRRRKAEISCRQYRGTYEGHGHRTTAEQYRQRDYAAAEHDYRYATDPAYAAAYDEQQAQREKREAAFFKRQEQNQDRRLRRAIIAGWDVETRKKRLRECLDWMLEPEKLPRKILLADLKRNLPLVRRSLEHSRQSNEPSEIIEIIARKLVRLRICYTAERLAYWRDLRTAKILKEDA
jgi:hypothetical protein